MATSILALARCLQAVKTCKANLCAVRTLQTSFAARKKNSNDRRTSSSDGPKSEKEELVEAAGEVASSMKGLEMEALGDLLTQIDKLHIPVQPQVKDRLTPSPLNVAVKDAAVKAEKMKKRSILNELKRPQADTSNKSMSPTLEKLLDGVSEPGSGAEATSTRPDRTGTIQSKARQHLRQADADDDISEAASYAESKPRRHSRQADVEDYRSEAASYAEDMDKPRRSRPQRDGRKRTLLELSRKDNNLPGGYIRGEDLLDGVEPLNIFNPSKWSSSDKSEAIPMLQSWVELYDKQIKDLQPFTNNGFEEMIRWTEEGKMWTYPIDNEQGMDEELNTPFYEHVFLEKHLAPFPDTGPIRRFMDLVLFGLSKNPHLSVREKVAHIKWFENYFKEKQPLIISEQLLKECAV